jgi:hypothetical protein
MLAKLRFAGGVNPLVNGGLKAKAETRMRSKDSRSSPLGG